MAFLGVKDLLEIQEKYKVVLPFDESRVKNGAYELSLGSEVYLTDSKTGKVEIVDKEKNRQVDINPGQFALLLTQEQVNVPKNKIAFISIKASEKLKGLINVSGFHVDPGFNDHLLFSVYNAGPSIIVLNCGEPYFPIWFADLKTELKEEEAYGKNNEHFKKFDHIPPKYIEFLKRGELTSPKSLYDKIKEVEASLTEKIIKSDEKKERNEWLRKAIIALLLTIAVKLLWDWAAFERGYKAGRNVKSIKEEIIKETKSSYVDSLLSKKIDSVLIKRNVYDTTKK